MRNLLGVLAGVALMIGAVGVAQASETGFGDWGTAYYDEVLGGFSINYVADYSPSLDAGSVNYAGCSSCDNAYKGCGDCGSSHGTYHAQPVKADCSSCGSSHSGGCSGGGCGAGSGSDIIGYGDEDWDWYTL